MDKVVVTPEEEALRACAYGDIDYTFEFNKVGASKLCEYIESLRHDITEANAELARHHRDFNIIRAVLDVADNFVDGLPVLRAIRAVVG